MKNKLEEIKALSEQLSTELENLTTFPYFYETLTAFNLGEAPSKKIGRLNAMAQIEQVYLKHIESLQEKIHSQLSELVTSEVKL
ncbi:hypothetical protein [Avibacterium sp. 21-594]|uniref:hypothetical protein n=1 Tax=Avibacterium sp. 21-594 TaxID=2911535 RepID=UPI0022466577|nr:hypothetical protein [Avibacterium sp. 21-594]MCW9715838.1 hypothetical protein [Avibacterium sp. 21-594]